MSSTLTLYSFIQQLLRTCCGPGSVASVDGLHHEGRTPGTWLGEGRCGQWVQRTPGGRTGTENGSRVQGERPALCSSNQGDSGRDFEGKDHKVRLWMVYW